MSHSTERSQTKKVSFIRNSGTGKNQPIMTESLSGIAWGWGHGVGIYYQGAEGTFRDDGNGLDFDCGGVYRGVCICQDSKPYT